MSQSSAVQRVYQVEPIHAFFRVARKCKIAIFGWAELAVHRDVWLDAKKEAKLIAKTRRTATRDRTVAGPATIGGDLFSSL